MRRTVLPLCVALAVLLVAVGGVTAADATDTTPPTTDGDVGTCVVGADSPCNGDDDSLGSEPIHGGDSEDGRLWIPEDQNRDGEIDDRFVGADSVAALVAHAFSLVGTA